MTDTTHTGLRARIEPMLNKLRAAASSRKLTSAEVFTMTDPIMDALAREPAPPDPQETAPSITAVFETVDDSVPVTGTTGAPIKRIEQQDDGSFTVVIDHWPSAAPTDNTALVMLDAATAYHRKLAQDQFDKGIDGWMANDWTARKMKELADEIRAALASRPAAPRPDSDVATENKRLREALTQLACRQNWDGYEWVGTGFTGRCIASAALTDPANNRSAGDA